MRSLHTSALPTLTCIGTTVAACTLLTRHLLVLAGSYVGFCQQ